MIAGVWMSLLWGALAASSLMLGALLGVVRPWSDAVVGSVLGFGAGALIASISFELFEEGYDTGASVALTVGLAAGAVVFYASDREVERIGGRSANGAAGLPLALGAFLDGIPEQAVLGIGLAGGGDVSIALLVAIFVSNLPEAIGSATDMRQAGSPTRDVLLLWGGVATLCALASVGGYLAAEATGEQFVAGVDGFAAGALLVMLVGAMIPEAQRKVHEKAGLAGVLGFALAAALALAG
ncbi:ZIP family zinc transporter [Mumia flava]|uniref:ZIP family zinc transporter n=2 Tax=Mumia flava TaxID=1348852 RepID=A0A2M9BIC5_9ACTN|nr:ZIP family zinc transporter [Mumia flava]